MASSIRFLCIIITMATVNFLAGASNQYNVGDAEGWHLPDANNTDVYKIWASKFTFHVGDSIVFEYKNDSVVKVDKRGYYHCNETGHGSMFKDGHTVFLLDKPEFYYFASGDLDHCKKGQRLMIEVKGQHSSPSIAAPSLSPRPSAAVSWIIPSFGTLMALVTLMLLACHGPYLA
ncbi:mavicyanin-like [Phoenix dactylifera]|uniref:Mavicyanin-like n=1 Tax=Phoenix dactylifera TaxID=42345 RepID=A0A8B9AFX0_PHODC|nr:mavicyanin-like [Phoenix dactylifera]XP_038985621.1 mavicyanin-like [Phoenix dactylifera]XP_038985622.1 mavicyanin-like [Phoenix dactylifera]